MTSHDQSPRAFAAAVVLLAALLLISRLIIERAPAREWGIALLLLALGIGLLLWDAYARRPLTYPIDRGPAPQSDPVIREYLPPAPPSALIPPVPTGAAQAEPAAPQTTSPSPADAPPSAANAPEMPETETPVDASPEAAGGAEDAPAAADAVEVAAASAPPPAEAEPAASSEPTSSPASAPADDDLTIIEGIGPKISAALAAAGIRTYADLAAAPEPRIREILTQAHLRIVGSVSASIPTWAEQAALAAAGRFDALKAWQAEHKSGRQ